MSQTDQTERFYKEVWPHRAAVLRTAQFLAANHADAEDLAQETLLKAFRALDRLQKDSNPRAWLMTILRNTHIDRMRSGGADVGSLDQLEVALPAPVEQPAMSALTHDPEALLESFSDHDIIAALKSLPREIRWTLLLVDIEGLPEDQAGEILEIPVGTVKSRIHRGRRMLYETLAPSWK